MTNAVELKNVSKVFPVPGSKTGVRALDEVTLAIEKGETVGIVGESGCGKSTLAKVLVGLEQPTSGTVTIDSEVVSGLSKREFRPYRKHIQMVFQDPFGSLNPRQRVGATVGEVLKVHRFGANNRQREQRVLELLDMVGLGVCFADRLPGQLSGGQRQRVGIARALAVEPSVLILDESISALDVSVQASVMNLLVELRENLGLTYLFIAHDLSMVRHISDRIAVMYLGRVVEVGSWQSVSDDPMHPYSQALQKAIPVANPDIELSGIERPIEGEIPNPANPPSGCPFHPRCHMAVEQCGVAKPDLLEVRNRMVACDVVSR